jgi:HAD superfamily hydrolase (TIGR01509 family)
VVTNSEALIVRALLRETGLHDLFDDILSCEDAPRPKPAPDLYLAAAARLGMDPARCLVVEDSDQGITAAGLARMAWVDVRVTNWQMRCDALLRSFGAILA